MPEVKVPLEDLKKKLDKDELRKRAIERLREAIEKGTQDVDKLRKRLEDKLGIKLPDPDKLPEAPSQPPSAPSVAHADVPDPVGARPVTRRASRARAPPASSSTTCSRHEEDRSRHRVQPRPRRRRDGPRRDRRGVPVLQRQPGPAVRADDVAEGARPQRRQPRARQRDPLRRQPRRRHRRHDAGARARTARSWPSSTSSSTSASATSRRTRPSGSARARRSA